MIKTLLTRISILSQYNPENKTILWKDPTRNRWDNIYGNLAENDNAIFISNDKLLIGTISQVNFGESLLCINIEEVNCQNDQFLRLHTAYPELISRVKANFQPFIHPLQLDISQIIADAKSQNFIDFYILSGEQKYNDLFQSFKENDRIVLLNNNSQFENVKLNSKQGLINFPAELNVNISIDGLTIDEVIQKNKNYKRKSTKSNNVTRIEKIKNETAINGFFKFTSFFTYYNTLINKSVYEKSDSNINTIFLSPNETIFKVSMSGKDINDDSFTFLNDNNLIIVHDSTKAKGTSYQTQSDTFDKQMKIGDYFYMCRGNRNLEIIGRITSDTIPCEYKDFGIHGWMQRSYDIVSEAIKEESYADGKKWWTPNDNSTCIAIPNREIKQANTKIFIPFFDTQFESKITPLITIHEDKIMSQNLNQILYGPPGTGKTYNTVLEAAKIITGNESISYEDSLDIFNTNLNNQIEFITFHQNYSYEDFIQGIRPDIENGKELSFEKKDGIFKRIADRAYKNLEESKNPGSAKKEFDRVFQELIKPLNDGDVEELEIKMIKSSFYLTEIGEKSIEFRKNIGASKHTLSINTLRKMYEKGENDIILGGLQPYYNPILSLLLEKGKSHLMQVERKNYVIIIDEINRANISRVFGELITLIEKDKRSEGKIAMRVTLPSGDPFIVPSNLYIIGTMNTADKSIALLDIALRRRFDFIPKYPDPLLPGVHDREVLTLLNKAVQSRKGYDFTIGHAYFMGDDYTLENTVNKKVIPLLLEYFMNNEDEVTKIFKEANITIGEWPLKMIS